MTRVKLIEGPARAFADYVLRADEPTELPDGLAAKLARIGMVQIVEEQEQEQEQESRPAGRRR